MKLTVPKARADRHLQTTSVGDLRPGNFVSQQHCRRSPPMRHIELVELAGSQVSEASSQNRRRRSHQTEQLRVIVLTPAWLRLSACQLSSCSLLDARHSALPTYQNVGSRYTLAQHSVVDMTHRCCLQSLPCHTCPLISQAFVVRTTHVRSRLASA